MYFIIMDKWHVPYLPCQHYHQIEADGKHTVWGVRLGHSHDLHEDVVPYGVLDTLTDRTLLHVFLQQELLHILNIWTEEIHEVHLVVAAVFLLVLWEVDVLE